MDAAMIGGSPIELTVGGQRLKFASLTLGDMSDFEAWAGGMYLENALRAIEDAEPGDKIIAFDRAWDQAQTRGNSMMGTMRGVRMLLWLTLRTHQPDMTLEDVGRFVTGQNLAQMNKLLDKLSGGGLPEDDERPPVQGVGVPP